MFWYFFIYLLMIIAGGIALVIFGAGCRCIYNKFIAKRKCWPELKCKCNCGCDGVRVKPDN